MAAAGRTWRSWQLLVTALAALILGAGIGTAGSSADSDALEAAERKVAAAQTVADDMTRKAGTLSGDLDRALRATSTAPPPTTGTTGTTSPPTTRSTTTTAPPGPKTTFGNGQYRVGTDIAPGTYVAPGGSGCYWERQATFGGGSVGDIIANDLSFGGQVVVTIAATDRGFKTSSCGIWVPG